MSTNRGIKRKRKAVCVNHENIYNINAFTSKGSVWGDKFKVMKMRVFKLFWCQIAYLAEYAKWQMPNCIFS